MHRYVKKQSEEVDDLFEGEKKGTREKGFDKGQSKRIWGELYKVVDSSDVVIQVGSCIAHLIWMGICLSLLQARSVCDLAKMFSVMAVCSVQLWWVRIADMSLDLQVLDARDPLGTRCRYLEHHLKRNARHKHMLLLLNKCDLVRLLSTFVHPCSNTALLRLRPCTTHCVNAHGILLILTYIMCCSGDIYCSRIDTMRCFAGACMGNQEMAAAPVQGIPHPGLPRFHHKSLWQGQSAFPAAAVGPLALRQEVYLSGLCGLPQCGQVLSY